MAKYMAMIGTAAPLMVSETVISLRSMSANASSMSASVSTAMPDPAHLALGHRIVGVEPALGGQIEGHVEPVWPCLIR